MRERTSTDLWIWAPGVAIGDAAYDAQWVVESAMPALARAWLAPTVRAALAGSGTSFGIAEGLAVATTLTAVDDAVRLVALAHAAIALARGGVLLGQRWRAAAGELGGQGDDGGLAATVPTIDGVVRFAADPGAGVTLITAPAGALGGAVAPYELQREQLAVRVGAVETSRAGLSVVTVDGGELRAIVPDVDAEVARWRAAVRVLTALAQPLSTAGPPPWSCRTSSWQVAGVALPAASVTTKCTV